MIRQIQLDNFRGFRHHVVDLSELSVIVGRNNAGKSSLIEAIRIISMVVKRFSNGKFEQSPFWVPDAGIGIETFLGDVERKSDAFFYQYGEPPARISAAFESGANLKIFIGEKQTIHAQGQGRDGKEIKTKASAKNIGFPSISILPQIAPIKDSETVLRKTYVDKCIETHLASRHFRNQIRYMYDRYDEFCEMFAKTWPGVSVHSFDSPNAKWEEPLILMLREGNFVAEIADFGHGIHVWLQLVWFLSRLKSDAVVVLDEPDVYLHPEQQAAIIDLIRGRFQQTILSTHSLQILSSCNESEILRLDRRLKQSSNGRTEEDHQGMLASMEGEQQTPMITKRSFKICAFLYGDAAISVKTANNETVLAMNPEFDGYNETVSIDAQVLHVRMDNPDDVVLYVNDDAIPLEVYSGKELAEFTIDLDEF